MTKKKPRKYNPTIKIEGIFPVLGDDYELIMCKFTHKIDDEIVSRNIVIRYYNPQKIKAHTRTNVDIDLVNLHWLLFMKNILKYKGFK